MSKEKEDTRYSTEEVTAEQKEKNRKKKQRKVNAEVKRLEAIFESADQDRYDLVNNLIGEAAFLYVEIEELKEDISINGTMVKYQNGANQFGYKKSPSVENYSSFIKQYQSILKQLIAILPEVEMNGTLKEELMEMINGKPT